MVGVDYESRMKARMWLGTFAALLGAMVTIFLAYWGWDDEYQEKLNTRMHAPQASQSSSMVALSVPTGPAAEAAKRLLAERDIPVVDRDGVLLVNMRYGSLAHAVLGVAGLAPEMGQFLFQDISADPDEDQELYEVQKRLAIVNMTARMVETIDERVRFCRIQIRRLPGGQEMVEVLLAQAPGQTMDQKCLRSIAATVADCLEGVDVANVRVGSMRGELLFDGSREGENEQ